MVRKPATLKDVAALANVSRATAARALNSYGYVGDETAQKVQAAAEKLGYRGNRLAQALRSGQLPIVGCILGDIQNPFFARIAHDIEVLARECGHNLVIGSSEEELAQEISLLASLRSLSIRGFIVAPTSQGNNAHLQGLIDENVPLVLIDRVAEGVDCDSVVVDNEGGARKAVEYLIGMGHTRIGLLQDDMRIFTSRERRSGYRSALAAAGIAADDRMVAVSQSTVEHAVDATIRLFSQKSPPTALFTVDSLMTQGGAPGLPFHGRFHPARRLPHRFRRLQSGNFHRSADYRRLAARLRNRPRGRPRAVRKARRQGRGAAENPL